MKILKKIIIAVFTLVLSMLIIPVLVIKLASADTGMVLCFLLFFVIDPMVILSLSIMAGTDLRKLWWIPIVSALIFPVFFGAAVQEIVVELFVYAALYLGAGTIAMVGTHLGIKAANKRKHAPM